MIENVGDSSSASALDGMRWQEFEMLVGEAFRRGGYTVSETGGGGADGGIDLVLTRDGEKFLVQCKQWKDFKVSVTIIRELYGVMAATGAVGGFVVTSGTFTQEARDFAAGRNIDLIDGITLKEMIGSTRQSAIPQDAAASVAIPACPKCGNGMVKRTARQGANAGKSFWGCSNYPRCRGTIPIE